MRSLGFQPTSVAVISKIYDATCWETHVGENTIRGKELVWCLRHCSLDFRMNQNVTCRQLDGTSITRPWSLKALGAAVVSVRGR